MASKILDTKIRTLIKAFLVLNKGKKYTARQISDFINCGEFHLNQSSVTPHQVTYYINMGKYVPKHILYGVHVEKIQGRNHYWLN